MEQKKLMSGMRPTGKLHLGHYMGVLTNWVKLQNDYDCFYGIADWHALTTKYDKTEDFKQNILDVAMDWLACGIDPEKSTIYLQSLIPETAVLHVLMSMVTPQNWVERDPTLKDMAKILRNNDSQTSAVSYGLMGYPVLMSCDIFSFNANVVPVGIDQVAHIEITRDIARRFNYLYKTEYLNEPEPLLTQIPLLKGVDGQKMGKSFNNDIKISDDEETTAKKIMQCITDRSRARKDDPGHPDKCEVTFPYYQAFADEQTVKCVECECKAGTRGCADCKRQLGKIVNEKFRPIREKRLEFSKNPDTVKDIIYQGSKKAQKEVQTVLQNVQDIMKLYI